LGPAYAGWVCLNRVCMSGCLGPLEEGPGVATASLRSSLLGRTLLARVLEILDPLHRVLIREAGFLGGDPLGLRHDEVLTAIETGEVVACSLIGGDHAPLVVRTLLELGQVLCRAPTDDHINVVIDGRGPRVLRSRRTRLMGELETRRGELPIRTFAAPLAGKRVLRPLRGLHGPEPQTAVRAVVLENGQARVLRLYVRLYRLTNGASRQFRTLRDAQICP